MERIEGWYISTYCAHEGSTKVDVYHGRMRGAILAHSMPESSTPLSSFFPTHTALGESVEVSFPRTSRNPCDNLKPGLGLTKIQTQGSKGIRSVPQTHTR